jgi:hypothetical protein
VRTQVADLLTATGEKECFTRGNLHSCGGSIGVLLTHDNIERLDTLGIFQIDVYRRNTSGRNCLCDLSLVVEAGGKLIELRRRVVGGDHGGGGLLVVSCVPHEQMTVGDRVGSVDGVGAGAGAGGGIPGDADLQRLEER